jgi:hypothetical protein
LLPRPGLSEAPKPPKAPASAHLLVRHQDLLDLALVLLENRREAAHEVAHQRAARLAQQAAQLDEHGDDGLHQVALHHGRHEAAARTRRGLGAAAGAGAGAGCLLLVVGGEAASGHLAAGGEGGDE